MSADILSSKEAEYTKDSIEKLKNVEWAKPLIANIQKNGGICSKAMPLLFEARFAYQIYKANIAAEYEYSAGVGNLTIEFKLNTLPSWLIELVSIRESNPLKNATGKTLNNKDLLQSEEAEMIRIGGKVGEKVLLKGSPTKFPIPKNSYHLILVDMCGYLGSGGDRYDYEHIGCGYSTTTNPYSPRYWNGEIIKGIFEATNTKVKAAKILQERIHFIGFINEKDYIDDEMKNNTVYAPNHNLMLDKKMLDKAWETYPLKSETREAK